MFSWAKFLTYALITTATPGPNTLISLSTASRLGLKRALPLNFGIWAGFSIVMILCTAFCSLLSSLIHTLETPMLLLGALYMLHLAWKTYKSPPDLSEYDARSGFWAGFTLQFVNPKIYIYCIVSMEAYILPHFNDQPLILFGFAMLLASLGFVLTIAWGAFGSVFKLLFSRYAKTTNTIMALLLVYCAISLFL